MINARNGKYRNDSDSRWQPPGSENYWGAIPDGFPLRVPAGSGPPLLKQHEVERLPTQVDIHVKVFRSWIAEEFAEMREILDRIANRRFALVRRKDEFVSTPEHVGWIFYVEWAEPYHTPPEPVMPPAPSL